MGSRLELPLGSLSDGVVRLRQFGPADEDWVFETCSGDREISRWTRVPWPYLREHARDWALTTVGRPSLALQTHRENTWSRRVAERAGFRRVPEADRGEAEGLLVFRRDAPAAG